MKEASEVSEASILNHLSGKSPFNISHEWLQEVPQQQQAGISQSIPSLKWHQVTL